MYTSIVSKFNMWQTIFPCFQVLFNDSTQQRRQSSIYYFSLTIRLWMTGSRKQQLGSQLSPQSLPKVTQKLGIPIRNNGPRHAM
jgi:hypothetical protein